MKIIIAPNSFKGSLDAFKVAQAIERGIEKSRLKANCQLFPIADGGDHTLEVFRNIWGGEIRSAEVNDPLGRQITSQWLMLDDRKTAVIEMAKASGLNLLDASELDPTQTNTYGTGQLMMEAIKSGATKIILGIGGSATVDAGLGMMKALGAKLINGNGDDTNSLGNPLLDLSAIEVTDFQSHLKDIEIIILSDVQNPLLGRHGAAYVFGPQKGADDELVKRLETSMENFNEIILKMTGKEFENMKGAGAAGGLAVGLMAFCDTKLIGGVEFLMDKMGLENHLQYSGLLITAEGKVDEQTLGGKGPMGVAAKAKAMGVPTIMLAGKVEGLDQLSEAFSAVFPITNGPMGLEEAINQTEKDLEDTAWQIGNLLAAYR